MATARTIRCKWESGEIALGMDEAGSGSSVVLLPGLSSISTRAEMQPFFDLLAPESESAASTGLGLAICAPYGLVG
jgi:hypothetical protein